MSKEIYISTTPHETRLAIVEDEQLAEIYFERENEYTLAGSIYNGKVTRVLPGMQSSFVDLGLERDAFLYVTDFMEEQGDAADFETDAGRKPPREAAREVNREAPPASREGERRARGERGRSRERSAVPEPAGETESFDEPIAPHPSDATGALPQDNMAALDEQGSRRWRGRRGRRRGRSSREGGTNADAVTGTYAEQVEPELLATGTGDETIVLEGSSEMDDESAPIEIDLASEPREPESAGYGYSRRIRENRREERARERGFGGPQERGARSEPRRFAANEAPDNDLDAVPASSNASASVPFVLPGESIRKYRDPAEVQAEDAMQRAKSPVSREIAAPVAPSVEIVGWDGGFVLPGESLSRHRRRDVSIASTTSALAPAGTQSATAAKEPMPEAASPLAVEPNVMAAKTEHVEGSSQDPPQAYNEETLLEAPQASHLGPSDAAEEDVTAPTPIPDVAAIAPAAAPEETGGLTQHLAHADASAAVSPVMEAKDPGGDEPEEYEPAEGERASLNESSRRDLRRREQRSEEPTASVDSGAAEPAQTGDVRTGVTEAAEAETMGNAPDATVYDLASHSSSTAGMDEPLAAPPEHDFTSLQPSGEMLSEAPVLTGDAVPEALPSQDDEHATSPISMEGAVLQASDERMETTPVFSEDESMPQEPGEIENGAVAQLHAYGDGDLEEEEVDGEEFDYDLAMTALEEDESDDYEEETLEGTADQEAADASPMPQERRLGRNTRGTGDENDEESEDGAAAETGGFTVDDFGGEPDDAAQEQGVAEPQSSEGRGRREPRRGSRDRDRRSSSSGGGFRGGAGGDRGRGRNGRPSIQAQDLPAINDLLKPGQDVLVQIAKEPIAKKGARITSHIALPGRFLVFMPTVNHTGVSRKISSDEERRRLKSILLSEKGDAQGGFIVRTAADGASEEELRNDLRFLIQLWQDIKARSESSKSPALIYHDLSLVERILRDQVTDNFSAIWVDTESEYERVLRFLQRFQPSLVRRVKLYTKETPIFEHFGVTQEIDRALKSKVWLKSGGSIVIDQTEALVAIDINTGKYVGKTARLEDTILKTNLDAIPEIVRQIRLRDLGGIIVIDFIDMDERKNRAKVMQVLEDELRADRAPSKVLPFNDFGLVIMTRKRVKQSLERTLCIPDPITEGTGMIKSPITVANEIFVEMRKMHRHLERNDIMLRVHPEVVKQLKAVGGKRLQELEEMTRKTILVKSDPALNPEQFDIH